MTDHHFDILPVPFWPEAHSECQRLRSALAKAEDQRERWLLPVGICRTSDQTESKLGDPLKKT